MDLQVRKAVVLELEKLAALQRRIVGAMGRDQFVIAHNGPRLADLR
jgi:hypothetical protein